jgi:hypothetical protein
VRVANLPDNVAALDDAGRQPPTFEDLPAVLLSALLDHSAVHRHFCKAHQEE